MRAFAAPLLLAALLMGSSLAAAKAPSNKPITLSLIALNDFHGNILPPSGTFGQLFNVLPFNNNLVTMTLTGEQIRRLLEQQWEKPQPMGGRILSVSQGFSYAWDAQAPEGTAAGTGARIVPGSLQLQGVPLDMQKNYRVTVNNFMASGGDNFAILRDGRDVQTGEIDLVVAKIYLRARGVVKAPTEGRVTRQH